MKSDVAFLLVAASLVGCGSREAPELVAAREMLGAFVKPGADQVALTNALRPKPEDYAAVFVGDAAQKAQAVGERIWTKGKLVFRPATDQVAFVVGVPQPSLAKGDFKVCPPTFKDVAPMINPKATMYCFRFSKPNEPGTVGGYGLFFVNGHWALFPDSWRLAGAKTPTGATALPSTPPPQPTAPP